MKIVHVVLNYYPSIGGTQWLFQNISERLVKNYGDDVTVLTIDSFYASEKKKYKKILLPKESYNGVYIERFPFIRYHLPLFRLINRITNRIFHYRFEWVIEKLYGPLSVSLKKRLNSTEADVVCGSSSAYSFMNYPLRRKSNRKPFVFMGAIHFVAQNNQTDITQKKLAAIQQSEMYIANTQFEKDRLIALKVPAENIAVIGCGVDIDNFGYDANLNLRKELHIDDNDMVFGFVGRQEPVKSLDILIKAFVMLSAQYTNAKLVIAGADSWYTSELKKMIHTTECANNIFLLSNINEQQKIHLLQSIDIFVSASASESFGIVFIEAWACKKPVIGANVGAINCVIDDEVNGLLFNPFDANDLSDKMKFLIQQKDTRNAMGERGYKKVQQQYTWDIITEKYRNTYKQAIEKFKNN